jgi:uncharacterized membrane protein
MTPMNLLKAVIAAAVLSSFAAGAVAKPAKHHHHHKHHHKHKHAQHKR